MNTMPFESIRRVEFCETDMAGIVHFSNFFRYMEAAESDFLRSLGLDVTYLDGGVRYGFPRVAASCDYARPARFGDMLTIAVIVEKVGTKSVGYRYEFRRGTDELAVGRATAVFCRETGGGHLQSIPIPDETRRKLEGKLE